MHTLAQFYTTDLRIPKETRDCYTLKEFFEFFKTVSLDAITNPHVLNFISLLNRHFCPETIKRVVGIEESGIKRTGDLEIDHEAHSYFANGTPVHNTVAVSNDYPYDEFKNIYLKAYQSGYIKGVTTYRAGTMASVLASTDKETENNGYDEEVILDSVKMPDSTDATMKILKAEGRKWYMTIVWNETKTRPFALFVHTNHHEKSVTTHDAIERLFQLAEEKGVPVAFIESVKEKSSTDSNATKITRALSLLLRHGVAIKNIIRVLNKNENVFVGSFLFQITKYLSSFIKDGEKVEGETCSECGSSKIEYREGCKICIECGNSKCG